ncbi:hypothetical protein CR161_07395 [Prosthecochloris sp. ZM]|uniref:hypothetical protein n=1 Tax=Prosthecochloris sp. ZM TaxID=2283143 RepID=UPI000DF79EF6|nr:hypothetical protein [Prosthecochloris sp. ZM]RDD30552.1 hypothetical protein CR161_07395 [Prosthecochloris sp. ZM]
MRIAILILCCVFIVSCEKPNQPPEEKQKPEPSPQVTSKIQPQTAQKLEVVREAQVSFPAHKFGPSSRPGLSKSQIRAIVKLGSMTEADFKQTSVDLCKKYESRAASSFLVQFFSDASCLEQWDGTGLLRDSDWPHWLCRVTVETDTSGKLYARTFKLAVDESTGPERTDVLKK